MAAHDLINAAIKANDKAMKTAIKQGYPVQLPANQYLPKAMNGNIDLIHLGQFADLDAGFDEYRKQQAAQPVEQDFSDLDAGFAEWSAAQGGQTSVDAPTSVTGAVRTGSTSVGGQSTGSRSGRAYTGRGTAQEEIPSLDNMAVPVTAKTTTKTAKTVTKAEKKAEKEVKQANSTLSKADKALQTAQKKQTVAENNLRKKLDKAEIEAQKADAMRSAAKVTKKGNTTVIEPAQNVQQTKRKMQNLAKEEARAQAEYTKAQNDVRKAEERAKKAADRQHAANDRAQAASAFAARRTANSGAVSNGIVLDNDSPIQQLESTMPQSTPVTWNQPAQQTAPEISTLQQAVRADALKPKTATMLTPAQAREMGLVPDEAIGQGGQPGTAVNAFTDQDMRTVWANPDYKLDDEEYARAKKMSEDYFKQNFRGPNDRYFVGDPADQTNGTVEEMSRIYNKTHQSAAFTGGVLNSASGVGKVATRGAVKLAEQTGQDDLADALTEYGQQMDASISSVRTQHPVTSTLGTMAGKAAQYAATNPYFDSIAEASGLTGAAKFALNQGAQLAQDYAVSDLPQLYEDLSNEDLTTQQALRNFGINTLQDAAGNLAMGALSDYVIPKLTGRGAIESAGDVQRAASNTPAPVDDSVDAALFGNGIRQDLSGADIPSLGEADDYILGGLGRQADDVADAAKAAEPVAPVTDAVEEAAKVTEPVPTMPNESPITQEQWDQFVDVMSDMEAAHNREGADVFGKYIHTILDYEKGNAGMEDVDEAFRQAQYELQQMGMGVDDSIHKIINPDYRESNMLFESAYRQYNGKYPEAAGAYRQAQKEFDEVLADPNATRDQIIEAGERVKKTIRSLDGKVKRGESAGARGELGDQLAELRKEMGATGEGKTIKVYADPKWADKEFGYEKRMRKQGPGVYEKVKRGKTRLYKHVSAQDRLKGTGITLVDDPKLATGGTIYGKEDLRNYLSRAMELQGGKKKSLSDVKTDIGKYSDEVVNMKVNEALESRGFERATPMSEEELSYYRLYGDEEGVEAPDNWQSLFDEPAPARSMEEAVDEIPSVQSIAEDTGIPNQTDEVLNIGADEIPSATRQAEPIPAMSAEEAVDNGIPALADEAEETAKATSDDIPSVNTAENMAARKAELEELFDRIRYSYRRRNGILEQYDPKTGKTITKDEYNQLYDELSNINVREEYNIPNTELGDAIADYAVIKDHVATAANINDDEVPEELLRELDAARDRVRTLSGNPDWDSDDLIEMKWPGWKDDLAPKSANHANQSDAAWSEAELDEAIKDVPQLGPKVDPVDRQLERVAGQSGKSREYIGKTRTNSIQNSGIDDLAEQTDVIPESLFKHSSIPEKQTMHNAYLKVELEQQAQIDRFAKRMSSEELGQLGSEDVDTMFILRNTLNKQAREATDEATKAELYRLSREVALNIDQVGHSRGQTLQSFRKWAHTYDGAVATAEGRLYKAVDDQLRSNPRMQAEIDSVAHQIFDRIGEIDSIDDVEKQVHDIVRQAMEDSRYLKGKVDDATVTKLTDSILKEKSFEGIQEQLDFLATGHEHLSMDTLDQVQKLFDEASEFDYGSKDYYQREMQAYALLANDMFPKGSSFRSKFDQWRYFAMLANPTTHIKNMTGNVLFGQGAVGAKNNLAAVIEASADRVSKATGGKGIDRTKSLINPFSKKDKGLLEAARQDAFDKSYRALTGTGRYLDPARGIDQAIPTWSTQSRLGRALNAATGFNNRLLSGEDEVAMIAKYQTSLAGYLKANGYDANIFKATDDESLRVLDSARAYALRQAEEAAFHQNSNLAKQMTQFTQNLRNSDKLIDRTVGTAADIAIPFKKTPINILKSCFAYSPLEFAKVAAEIPDLYKGVIKPADFIDDLSKGLTGTAGLVIGALLAHGGVIEAGSSEGDKEAAFDKTAGRQNNAVKIGGKQIGLAELVPAAAPIIFGAIMYETKRESEKNGNAALDTIVNGAMGLTDAVTDMTMLSGIADIIADAKSAQSKGETFTNIAGGLVENLVGQMLPTVGRKAEITVDDTKRSTYSDRSGTMKQLDSSAKYWQTKIPGSQALGEKLEQSEIPMLQSVGSRLTLEPAVDAWGREIKQTGGNLGGRAAYNFLSPVTISSESQDPTDQELYALSDQTGSDDVFHQMPQTDSKFKVDGEDVKLSESQWTEYQKRNGTMAKELVDALISSDLYATMSDDDKVEAIKDIYSYTKDAAQHEVGGKVMNSTNAKMYAAYQEGGAEAVIGELEYLNGITTAENETGLEVANNAKTRGVYEEYGAEGVQAYAEMKDRFNEIKAGREEQYGKGSKNVNIMTTLTLLNENPDQAEVILGSIASNSDKYEQMGNGWIYHQGDKILSADDVTEPVTTEEPITELEQSQPSQAKAASKAARQQMSELRATQQPEAEEIPVLEEQPVQEEPKPVQQTASNVEINPATGRPVAPKRQAEEPAVEIDPRTGRPKAPSRSNEVIQPQGEIPKLEPNGDATWNNNWKIENSKSYGRFRQVDPSYNASDYARVYNAMDTDNSGKLKKAEIQNYLDAMSGVDEAYRWAMFNAFAQSNWSNPYKK